MCRGGGLLEPPSPGMIGLTASLVNVGRCLYVVLQKKSLPLHFHLLLRGGDFAFENKSSFIYLSEGSEEEIWLKYK